MVAIETQTISNPTGVILYLTPGASRVIRGQQPKALGTGDEDEVDGKTRQLRSAGEVQKMSMMCCTAIARRVSSARLFPDGRAEAGYQ